MAAPSALTLYYPFKAKLGDGTIDLNAGAGTIACTLHTSTYTPSTSHSTTADLTNEFATANGYTAGGYTLTSSSYTQTGGTAKWATGNNPTWIASGAGLSGMYYAVFNYATHLIGYMLLDSAPASVTLAAGNVMTITQNANGWLTNT
jgi:hypothetical protein